MKHIVPFITVKTFFIFKMKLFGCFRFMNEVLFTFFCNPLFVSTYVCCFLLFSISNVNSNFQCLDMFVTISYSVIYFVRYFEHCFRSLKYKLLFSRYLSIFPTTTCLNIFSSIRYISFLIDIIKQNSIGILKLHVQFCEFCRQRNNTALF